METGGCCRGSASLKETHVALWIQRIRCASIAQYKCESVCKSLVNASFPGLADSTAGLQLKKAPCSFGSPGWPRLQTRTVSLRAQLVFSVFVTTSLSNTNATEREKMQFQDSSMPFSLSDSLEKKHPSVCFPVKS